MVRAAALVTGLAILFVATTAPQANAAAPVDSSRYKCGTGRVGKVATLREVANEAFKQSGQPASELTDTSDDWRRVRWFLLTVQFEGRFYVIRARANDSWNLNPLSLRRGESLSVCVNATEMVLDRGDGTDFRGKVIRIQREVADALPGLD